MSRAASAGDIKSAYFKLAKKYHPDINKAANANDKFADINRYLYMLARLLGDRAYEVLSDDYKRKEYDSTKGAHAEQQTRERSTKSQRRQQDQTDRANMDEEAFARGFEDLNELFRKKKRQPRKERGTSDGGSKFSSDVHLGKLHNPDTMSEKTWRSTSWSRWKGP